MEAKPKVKPRLLVKPKVKPLLLTKPVKPKVKPRLPLVPSTKSTLWFLDRPLEDYAWTKSGDYLAPDGQKYLLPNNKQFGRWINEHYQQFKLSQEVEFNCDQSTESEQAKAFLYQQFIAQYMAPTTPYRGILIYHGLGSGKTRTAIDTAEQYRAMGVKILVLLPAALKPTWFNQLKKWGRSDLQRPTDWATKSSMNKYAIDKVLDHRINANYQFVSYNAHNTTTQLNRLIAKDGHPTLQHRLIIVDETHNLISMMYNSTSKKGSKLYHALMDAVDCKFLFLSATPLLNFPYEIGILFNILRGPMKFTAQQRISLFPEKERDFDQYFVNYGTQQITNPDLFKKRLSGLVSYYYGAKGDVYPELVLHDPIEIPMSNYQFTKYREVRLQEIDRERQTRRTSEREGITLIRGTQTPTDIKVSHTFRIFSRVLSNFVYPNQLRRPMPNDFLNLVQLKLDPNPHQWTSDQIRQLQNLIGQGDDYTDFAEQYRNSSLQQRMELLNSLTEVAQFSEYSGLKNDEEQFIYPNLEVPADYDQAIDQSLKILHTNLELNFKTNLAQLSPKMLAIYQQLITGEGSEGPALVYSQFRTIEGVRLFSMVLEAHGMTNLMDVLHQITPQNIEQYVIPPQDPEAPLRYVIYSGQEDLDTRDKILQVINHPANQNRGICAVFLGTAAAAEGISLKFFTQVHIMEPYWNEVRISQIIGRARRICSHFGLPKDRQKVHVYRYHTVFTEQQKANFVEDLTTDQAIYFIAQTKKKINQQFLQILKDSAVDCQLNLEHNVAPDNPIKCFTFPREATGVAFSPSIVGQEKDIVAQIKVKEIQNPWNVYSQAGQAPQFYDSPAQSYRYVYRVEDPNQPQRMVREPIEITTKSGQIRVFSAIILYDHNLAKNANQLVPRKALLITKTGQKIIDARHFQKK